MANKIKDFWQSISLHDRKLIRWTAIVCYTILMVSLILLFFFSRHLKPTEELPDTTAKHEAPKEQPPVELPNPPQGSQELMAGLDSFDTHAHRELATIYAEREDFDKSILHARRIAPWLEEDLEFQGQIGQTFLKAGNPGEAIPHLEKALKLGGKTPELLADLALAKYRAVNVDSGITAIRAAEVAFPDNPLLMTHEAAMFGEAKSHGDVAETLFHKLLQKFPKYPEAHYQYGRFLMNQGNFGSSLKEIQQALSEDALDPRFHARLGMVYFHLNRDNDAERAYRTALAMNPRDYNTWFNLGELNLSLANETDRPALFAQKTREALEDYLTTLANHPDHPEAHYRVGVILSTNKEYREAIRHLQMALQSDPYSVRVLVQLATAWEALGDQVKAWDYAQQAYEIDPFNILVADQYRRLKQNGTKG